MDHPELNRTDLFICVFCDLSDYSTILKFFFTPAKRNSHLDDAGVKIELVPELLVEVHQVPAVAVLGHGDDALEGHGVGADRGGHLVQLAADAVLDLEFVSD